MDTPRVLEGYTDSVANENFDRLFGRAMSQSNTLVLEAIKKREEAESKEVQEIAKRVLENERKRVNDGSIGGRLMPTVGGSIPSGSFGSSGFPSSASSGGMATAHNRSAQLQSRSGTNQRSISYQHGMLHHPIAGGLPRGPQFSTTEFVSSASAATAASVYTPQPHLPPYTFLGVPGGVVPSAMDQQQSGGHLVHSVPSHSAMPTTLQFPTIQNAQTGGSYINMQFIFPPSPMVGGGGGPLHSGPPQAAPASNFLPFSSTISPYTAITNPAAAVARQHNQIVAGQAQTPVVVHQQQPAGGGPIGYQQQLPQHSQHFWPQQQHQYAKNNNNQHSVGINTMSSIYSQQQQSQYSFSQPSTNSKTNLSMPPARSPSKHAAGDFAIGVAAASVGGGMNKNDSGFSDHHQQQQRNAYPPSAAPDQQQKAQQHQQLLYHTQNGVESNWPEDLDDITIDSLLQQDVTPSSIHSQQQQYYPLQQLANNNGGNNQQDFGYL